MMATAGGRSHPHVRTVRRRLLAIVLVILLVSTAGLGLWLGGLQLTGNLRVVESGIVYRSAQLGGASLQEAIARYGIRSIINLRGPAPNAGWYRRELALADRLGLQHFDFALSATSQVDLNHISQLLAQMRLAPKPMLIHSKSGADRSGLASALFEYAVMFRPPEQAEGQLSLWYRHFPFLWSRTGAMDENTGSESAPRLARTIVLSQIRSERTGDAVRRDEALRRSGRRFELRAELARPCSA